MKTRKVSDINFVLKGRIVSNKDRNGIAGVVVSVLDSDSKKEIDQTISNEDGGFHFLFRFEDITANQAVALKLFDVDKKHLRSSEKAIPLGAKCEQTHVELTVDDKEIQHHRASVRSMKPRDGRVFSAEKMNEIYSAINQFSNTSKKYSFGSGMTPGLTCPFPETNDFDNILDDAWDTTQGDPGAFERFKNTLDTISFSMSQRGAGRTAIDFKSNQWREYIATRQHNNGRRQTNHSRTTSSPLGWLLSLPARVWKWMTGGKPETPAHSRRHDNPMVSLESAALLMRAADYIARKDDRLSNHYRNIVLSQLIEFTAVAPIYRTAHSAMLGDEKSQADLRSMTVLFGEDCRGGRSPFEVPFDRDSWDPSLFMEPELEDMLGCIDELSGPRLSAYQEFRIDSLSPNNGCEGDTAVLRGSGFIPGAEVMFVGARLGTFVRATPTRWSDTEIEFVIPSGATYGPVKLVYAHSNGVEVCGIHTSDAPFDRSEQPTLFVGGRPRIDSISFLKDDVPFDPSSETVWPGERVALVYEYTLNTLNHSVEVRGAQIQITNGSLSPDIPLDPYPFESTDEPGRTMQTMPPTDYNRTTRISCEISLTNGCGTTVGSASYIVHRPASVALLDTEVTQGIQFLNATEHMRNDDEAGDNNTVPLIAHKRTLVRVYYKTSQIAEFNQGKAVGLNVRLRGFIDGEELSGSPLSALNSNSLFAINTTNPWAQRGTLTTSANFILPDDWTIPTRRVEQLAGAVSRILDTPLTLIAELGLRPNEPWHRDTIDDNSDELTLTGLRFNSAAPMSCVVVRVNFTGPGSNGGIAPGFSRCRRTLTAVSRRYPTSDLELFRPPNTDEWLIDFSDDLTADPGDQLGCGDAWNALVDKLGTMAFWAHNDDQSVWVGCLHPDIPFMKVVGCGCTTVGAAGLLASSMDPSTESRAFRSTLHELGHSYGISKHTNEDDSRYPEYMGDGNSGIGEFGVDVAGIDMSDLSEIDKLVFPPGVLDIMFFKDNGTDRWFSPFTYQQLMQLFFSDASPSEAEASSALVLSRPFGEQIFVAGVVDESHRLRLLSPLFHLPAKPARPMGRPSGYEIVLLDADRRVIHKVPVQKHGNDKNRLRIFEHIPLIKATKYFEIRDIQQTPVLQIERNGEPPTLRELHLEKGDGLYTLTWRSGSRSGEFWCGVQLTCDDGQSWATVQEPQHVQTYSFDPSKFGGGKHCRLRVFVTDGLNTTHAETESFSLPIQPPEIHPVNFDSETEFFAGVAYELNVQPIYIVGVLHRSELTWYLNKKEVGKGKQIRISFEQGEQLLEVIPKDFEEATITFSISVKKNSQAASR
jgi:hypothetical protein